MLTWCYKTRLFTSATNWIRHKSKATHWAVLKHKKWPADRALKYFDDFYQPVFGKKWRSVRLGLLCPSKYCAVLNNFSNLDENKILMAEIGADDVQKRYQSEMKRYLRSVKYRHGKDKGNKSDDEQATLDHKQTTTTEPNGMESEEHNFETDTYGVVYDRGVGGLHQYMPATQMKGLEHFVDETDYTSHVDPSLEVPFSTVVEPPLDFPEHLHVHVFPRDDVSSFPRPKPDSLDLLGYYLMDAASILPVLMLGVQSGDSVLDLCSAPGGKALAILQCLNSGVIVCNDLKDNRIERLKNVFGSYIPALKNFERNIIFTKQDAEHWTEKNAFDKTGLFKNLLPANTRKMNLCKQQQQLSPIFSRFLTNPQLRTYWCPAMCCYRSLHVTKPLGDEAIFSKRQFTSLTLASRRLKSSGSRKKGNAAVNRKQDDNEANNWEAQTVDDLDEPGKDYKDVTAYVASLRLDSVLKAGLGMSKSKVETAFYQSRLRVNGIRVVKKSVIIELGDEADFVIGANSDNEKFLDVMRVTVRGVATHPEKERLQVTLRRFKRLTIQNYDDKWKQPLPTDEE